MSKVSENFNNFFGSLQRIFKVRRCQMRGKFQGKKEIVKKEKFKHVLSIFSKKKKLVKNG